MAPLWPYPVNTELTVDSFSPELVSMVDPSHTTASGTAETVSYSVLWGMTALENTTHTLVASMAVGGQFVVMDGLMCCLRFFSSRYSSFIPFFIAIPF